MMPECVMKNYKYLCGILFPVVQAPIVFKTSGCNGTVCVKKAPDNKKA
jgi:hypothetical protein